MTMYVLHTSESVSVVTSPTWFGRIPKNSITFKVYRNSHYAGFLTLRRSPSSICTSVSLGDDTPNGCPFLVNFVVSFGTNTNPDSGIDWSVCLLTLKHLVSLQDHTRPSFQTELDLHTTSDKLEKEIKKKKCWIYSLKRIPWERRLAIVFFSSQIYRDGMYIYSW